MSHFQLTVKTLAETLEGMHEREMYKEMTFYLSACQSGSMFGENLPENSQFLGLLELLLLDLHSLLTVYAVTSTNTKEPGLRCFCDTKLIPGVCIGHVFSVVWMEDTEQVSSQINQICEL
jgi:legumain